jgi:hypothetical protein
MATRGGSRGRPAAGRTRTRTRERQPVAPAPPRLDLARVPLLRALVARPNLSAALLLALPVLVYLWPVLVGGKIFAAIATLYAFGPWEHLSPRDLTSYFNFVLTDVPMADYPWRFFAREMIHDGTLPVWNPHVFAGTPFFSNPQTGIFSLFSLPIWVLPLNYGIALGAALKLWAGAFGCYLLVRELRLGFLPGLLAGVAFAFSALNITWLTHETLPAVAAMLPWSVWLVERVLARGGAGNVVGLAGVTAIGLGGGHPGMQLHLLVAVALYAVLRAVLLEGETPAGRARRLAFALGGLALGTLLMAFMLIPEALSSRNTIGTVARRGGQGSLPGTVMPFDAITTVLFPDWWGRATGFEVAGDTPESVASVVNFNERTFYAGAVALLLALVALVARGDWRRKGPFVGLAFIGLAIPLHAPVLYWLMTHLPFLRDVQSQRMHFIFAFGVAVLAAFGLRAVLESPRELGRFALVPAGAFALGLFALASAEASGADFSRLLKHFATGASYARPGVLALTSVAWFLLFVVGVGGGLLAMRRWPQWRLAVAAGLVVLAVADAQHFAAGYQPMAPAAKAVPPRTPAIAYLQRHAAEGRFLGVEYTLAQDWSLVYGLHDVRGYDPPQPTQRFYRLWRTANPDQSDWQPFIFSTLTPEALRVASILGAQHVIAGRGAELPKRPGPTLGALREVYSARDAVIFRNPLAAPRTLVPGDIVVTEDEDETRAKLVAEGFDPRRTVVVELDEPGIAEIASGTPAQGEITIAADEPARVTLEATLDRRGLVVLNDRLTDGWSVEVDGDAAPAVLVNDVMRGVIVDEGRHEIVWRYAVPGLRAGAGLSLLALLVAAGLLVLPRVRGARGFERST